MKPNDWLTLVLVTAACLLTFAITFELTQDAVLNYWLPDVEQHGSVYIYRGRVITPDSIIMHEDLEWSEGVLYSDGVIHFEPAFQSPRLLENETD